MLHGHSHGTLTYPFPAKMLDVGVDSHGFTPISYEEIKKHMSNIVTKPVDHHGEE
jgi:calcineurin-like phosphoesterase family protein